MSIISSGRARAAAAYVLRLVALLVIVLATASTWLAISATAAVAEDQYVLGLTIGGKGHGLGSFGGDGPGPYGVATDSQGNVYVADPFNQGAPVQKFTSNGEPVCVVAPFGSDSGQVYKAYGIAVGPDDVVYVLDTFRPNSYRIQKFSSVDGRHYASAGQIDTPDIPSGAAFYLAVDPAGAIYVAIKHLNDSPRARVLKYGPAGGTPIDISLGFDDPSGLSVDGSGDLIVGDDRSVRKIREVDVAQHEFRIVATWYGAGGGRRFQDVTGLAVDVQGSVYVCDWASGSVAKMTPGGVPVTWWGGRGSAPGSFDGPWGVAVSPRGAVYVADTNRTSANHRVQRFLHDASAPETTATVSPSGWTNAAHVTVVLSAHDAKVIDEHTSGLSPASPTQFSMDGGATWQDYTAPISITRGGQTDIWYRSHDAAGNVETPRTASARIDRMAPVTSVDNDSAWHHGPVTVHLTGSDRLSDVASTEYSLDGGATWTAATSATVRNEGITILRYRAIDKAGNVEPAKSARVKIDTSAPVTSSPELHGDPAAEWLSGPARVRLLGADPLSGVAATYYQLDGQGERLYEGPIRVDGEGPHRVAYWSMDDLGNSETTRTGYFRVDSTPPATTVSGIPSGWTRTPVTARFSAGDALSGVAKIESSTDAGATWTPGSSLTIEAEGITTIAYRAVDNAGNVEPLRTAVVRVDSGRPVPKALANVTVRRGKIAKLRYRVNDSACPQATVMIRILKAGKLLRTLRGGGRATNRRLTHLYRCRLQRGRYTWKVYATDLAGNSAVRPSVGRLTVR